MGRAVSGPSVCLTDRPAPTEKYMEFDLNSDGEIGEAPPRPSGHTSPLLGRGAVDCPSPCPPPTPHLLYVGALVSICLSGHVSVHLASNP